MTKKIEGFERKVRNNSRKINLLVGLVIIVALVMTMYVTVCAELDTGRQMTTDENSIENGSDAVAVQGNQVGKDSLNEQNVENSQDLGNTFSNEQTNTGNDTTGTDTNGTDTNKNNQGNLLAIGGTLVATLLAGRKLIQFDGVQKPEPLRYYNYPLTPFGPVTVNASGYRFERKFTSEVKKDENGHDNLIVYTKNGQGETYDTLALNLENGTIKAHNDYNKENITIAPPDKGGDRKTYLNKLNEFKYDLGYFNTDETATAKKYVTSVADQIQNAK